MPPWGGGGGTVYIARGEGGGWALGCVGVKASSGRPGPRSVPSPAHRDRALGDSRWSGLKAYHPPPPPRGRGHAVGGGGG